MADPSPLSERELDIMRMVVTGASNREIALALDISPNTVKVHLRNVFEKLGVASRTEATLVALREGLVNVQGVAAVEGNVAGQPLPIAIVPSQSLEEDGARAYTDEPTPTHADVYDLPAPTRIVQAVPAPTERTTVVTEVLVPAHLHASRFPGWLIPLLGGAVVVLLTLLGVMLLRDRSTAAPQTQVGVAVPRWRELARLPAPRSGAAAVGYGGDLVLVGGVGDDGAPGESFRYDPSLGRWEGFGSLPLPVSAAPAIAYGGNLLVAGGVDAEGNAVDAVQSYDPATGEWTQLAPLPRPLARGALATFEGDLFLFGGWDGSAAQSTILRFLPDEGAWEPAGTLPSPRADLAAASVQDGIVLAGGTDAEGEPLADVFLFDPRASDPLRAEAPLPAPQAAPRMVSIGNALYLVGTDAFLERDPQRQWQTLAPPDAALPARAALVASDPYIYLIGGEGENGPSSTVWEYRAIFYSFIPMVPGNSEQSSP